MVITFLVVGDGYEFSGASSQLERVVKGERSGNLIG